MVAHLVEHSTTDHMIEGLNTASLGTGREKIAKTLILHLKKLIACQW